MMEDKHRLFAEIDQDTILKLNKPNEIQSDWLKSLVEHVCEKWRAKQV